MNSVDIVVIAGPSTLDEKELRKAWLKQKFGSFEYHEEMLGLLRQWLDILRQALKRALNDTSPSKGDAARWYPTVADHARYFRDRYLPVIEQSDSLGKYRKNEWPKYRATATFRSVPDFARYLEAETGDVALAWMTPEESARLDVPWGQMARMAKNIQYTVDGMWMYKGSDDYILDESYTGPITWPPDWREDVLGKSGAGLLGLNAPRVRAGDPVPQAGQWRALDGTARVQQASVGDVLADLNSAYGITIWQRIGD